MKTPLNIDLANDNVTTEGHLVVATVALYAALKDLDVPRELLAKARSIKLPAKGASQWPTL
ncbi:hypothetical protein ASD99_29545 [Mesorhizobium sp. Root695]|jgi:hypothetical protein|nr:hypothetical protein ASD99_29545 [Mesorhizobium sp. Root695]